jgi:hypothetical protein
MNPMIIFLAHISRELDNKGSIFIESSKQGSSCTKASGSPGAKIQKTFPHMMGEINEMETISS